MGFFAQDEIPQPFSGERTKQRHFVDAFTAFRDSNIETVFD